MTFEQMAEILRLDARMRRIEEELKISEEKENTIVVRMHVSPLPLTDEQINDYIEETIVPTLSDLASEAREKFKEHTCPAFGLGCLDMTAAQISQCAAQPGPEGKCVMKGKE